MEEEQGWRITNYELSYDWKFLHGVFLSLQAEIDKGKKISHS